MAEWMTMSAPCSIGRHRYGVANVASTISGTPAACATSASAAMSAISPDGLAIASANTTFVRSVMAAATFSGSAPGTNVVSTPNRRSVTSSWVIVPPYRPAPATICSPAPASAAKVRNSAACPLAVATAPSPPSKLASRSSSADTVGFPIRL